MLTLLRLFAGLVLAGLFALTLAGAGAPFRPELDLINHFRLHLLAGTAAILILLMPLRMRRARWLALSLLTLNVVLALPTFRFSAERASGGTPFKVVSLNTWGENAQSDLVEAFLRGEDADIVFLLEVDPVLAPMLGRLAAAYPYRADCAAVHSCRLVLLSKRPLGQVEAVGRGALPPHISAQIDAGTRQATIYGVHLARPLHSMRHEQDLAALTARLDDIDGPRIVIGDFNMTPWSWAMTRFSMDTGLLRHATFGASWPERPPLFPQLLIDHVLTSADIGAIDNRRGPPVGSDHLPIVVRLAVP